MKKIIVLLLAFAFVFCSCTKPSVIESATENSAEDEILVEDNDNYECVYSNDFSEGVGSEIRTLYGSFTVKDGILRSAESGKGGYSTLLFDIGDFTDFVYEVDFVDHAGGGGLLFLCDGDSAVMERSDGFCGYMAYIGKDGGLGAIGCAGRDGAWSGNFGVSPQDVTDVGSDLHLRVRVSGDYIIYTLYDIATGEEIYRYEYIKGDSKKYDTSPYTKGMIGLRIYNDDGAGGFDNLKLFVNTKQTIDLNSTLYVGKQADMKVRISDFENFIFLKSESCGYALSYDCSVERFVLYDYDHGEMRFAAQCAMPQKKDSEISLSIINMEDRLLFYVEGRELPVFDIPHDAQEYELCASTRIEALIQDCEGVAVEPGYINPIADGADPEVLYFDGKYYLYTSKNKKVSVRTSTDLVNWQSQGYAFTLGADSVITSFMSPNVFYSDGLFYMIFAARTGGSTSSTSFKLYYASSASPLGPFKMRDDKSYINEENEIGGAPFIDDDGRIYISSVRFGEGNHIYLQEISAVDGVITPLTDAKRCISPTEHYEIDNYGRITEGGVILKHGGYYYMMYASGHYKGHYGEAYAVSKSLFGPWEKSEYNDVLNSNVYADGVGDCVFVRSRGDELFVMYHRHKEVGNEGASRMICIDRVYFSPAENEGSPDVLCIYGPTVTYQPMPKSE